MSDTDYLKDVDLDVLVETNERQKAISAKQPAEARDEFFKGKTPSQPRAAQVNLLCASAVVPEPVTWLWPGWLPSGKLTLLAGDGGTGKTTLAIALAAVVSAALHWPDNSRCVKHGNVLIWSSEDDPADTLVPRLMAAKADLTRCYFVQGVTVNDESQAFDPARDIDLLDERIRHLGGARLLIVDPIVSAIAGDMHRANDVRRSLQALVDFASRHGCAVLGITHFTKGTKGGSPTERVTGSQAFGALARMVLVAAKEEGSEKRVLARAKSNIAPDTGGFSYTLSVDDLENGISATHALWGEAINGTAREILGDVEADPEAETERDEAADFLRGLLSDGPKKVKEIRKDADGAGHSWRTIERAKREIGAEAKKVGMAEGWVWALLEDRQPNIEDRHTQYSGGLRDEWRSSADKGSNDDENGGDLPKAAKTANSAGVAAFGDSSGQAEVDV
ncbi:AAA family ATPase [Caballeronia sordidicola]|nr:AAA family ATPase [Caballeronia sordidicola]